MVPTAARARPASGPSIYGYPQVVLKRLQVPASAMTRLSLPVAAVLAVLGGLCVWLAFPDHNLWPLAPVGVALLALATREQRPRTAALLGLLTGLASFGPTLHWSGVYVGNLPWIALTVLQALYIALLGLTLPAAWRTRGWAPLVIAGLWVAQEALRGRTPYGGFPWARLAFSQTGAPTLHLAALGGAPLVSFAAALAGALLAYAVVHVRRGWLAGLGTVAARRRRRRRPAGPAADVRPDDPGGRGPGRRAVGRAELRRPARRRARPARQGGAAARRPGPGRAAGAAGPRALAGELLRPRPLPAGRRPGRRSRPRSTPSRRRSLVGAVLDSPPGKLSNVGIVWTPATGPGSSSTSSGTRCPSPSTSRCRSLLAVSSAARSTWSRRTWSPGHQRRAAAASGRSRSATSSASRSPTTGWCAQSSTAGAQLLVVQTNNATFGHTAETYQQLAMTPAAGRRARPHGRQMATTGGISGSSARTARSSQQSEPAVHPGAAESRRVPLRTAITAGGPAGRLARMAVLAVIGVVAAALAGRGRSSRPPTRREDGAGREPT